MKQIVAKEFLFLTGSFITFYIIIAIKLISRGGSEDDNVIGDSSYYAIILTGIYLGLRWFLYSLLWSVSVVTKSETRIKGRQKYIDVIVSLIAVIFILWAISIVGN